MDSAPGTLALSAERQENEPVLVRRQAAFRLPTPDAWDLQRGTLHVWRLDLYDAARHRAHHATVLSEDEGRRAGRYHFERDRTDFVVGRGYLRHLLGRYLGVAPARLGFTYGLHGKPALATGFDARLRFNVSHAGRLLLVVVGWEREVGIDVEAIRPLPDLDDVAATVFCPNERAVLGRLSGREKVENFFRCWTRKEAYIKADGNGFALPVRQFEVSLAAGEPARLILGAKGAERWSLRDLTPGDGYAAALAAEGHDGQVCSWQGGLEEVR